MKGIILAAGTASRLRPLTNDTPKCLLEIGGKTILARTLNNLIKNNINDLVIVTGYLEEKIKNYVKKNFPQLKVEFITNEKYDSTNNIYSFWLTKSSVLNNDIILLDSDIIFDEKIIKLLLKSGFKNCLAVKSDHTLGEEEIKVKLDEKKSIINISKKVNPEEAAGESIGIEIFNAETVNKLFNILDRKILVEKNVNQFYEAAFEELIADNTNIFAVDVGDLKCIEIDTADDIKSAEKKVVKFLNS